MDAEDDERRHDPAPQVARVLILEPGQRQRRHFVIEDGGGATLAGTQALPSDAPARRKSFVSPMTCGQAAR